MQLNIQAMWMMVCCGSSCVVSEVLLLLEQIYARTWKRTITISTETITDISTNWSQHGRHEKQMRRDEMKHSKSLFIMTTHNNNFQKATESLLEKAAAAVPGSGCNIWPWLHHFRTHIWPQLLQCVCRYAVWNPRGWLFYTAYDLEVFVLIELQRFYKGELPLMTVWLSLFVCVALSEIECGRSSKVQP